MERDTGLEPATSSLGRRHKIGNKEQGVSWHLFLAIEDIQFFTLCFGSVLNGAQTEHSSRSTIDGIAAAASRLLAEWPAGTNSVVCALPVIY